MSPQKQQMENVNNETPRTSAMSSSQATWATSPWTEAYHAMPSQDEAAERRFDETQAPTHDALSEIYNGGL